MSKINPIECGNKVHVDSYGSILATFTDDYPDYILSYYKASFWQVVKVMSLCHT